MNLSTSLIAMWPKILLRLSAFLVFALWAFSAHAFGGLGHAIVADLAQAQLTPAAAAEVRELLALEGHSQLNEVGSWADEVRNDPRFARSAPFHYVNFPRNSCTFERSRDCKDGVCVIGGIAAFSKQMSNPSASAATRLTALKWLVHLVADIHQPFHAGYGDDRGGNLFQIRYQNSGSNLHWLWDTGLLEAAGESRQNYVARLQASQLPDTQAFSAASPVRWAEESCRMLRDQEIYPKKRFIDRAYVERMRPLVDQRLRLAGVRLASTLNALLK